MPPLLSGARALNFRPSTASVDAWYTGYAVTVPALAGSWLTFLYLGAGLWALMNGAVRRYTLALPPRAIPFALACLAFPIVMILAGLAGGNYSVLPAFLLKSAAFAFVPLLISRYRFSDPARSLAALCVFAPLGAAAGLAVGTFQFLSGAQAPSGGAGNAAVYGAAMALLGSLSLAGLFEASRWLRVAAMAGFALGMGGVFLSQSRTLYPLAVFLPLLLVFTSPTKKATAWLAAAAISIGIAIGLLNSGAIKTGIRHAVEDVELMLEDDVKASSLGFRAALWEAALDAYAERPVLGYGPQNKMDVVARHMDERVAFVRFTHVHNAPLDAAVSAGTIGLAAFFAVMLSPLWLVFGQANEICQRRFVALSTLGIFGLVGITGTPFVHDLLLVMFLLPLIVVAASDPDPRNVVYWSGRKPLDAAG